MNIGLIGGERLAPKELGLYLHLDKGKTLLETVTELKTIPPAVFQKQAGGKKV